MKSRDAVIRLKRFEVEEKRRKVAEIEAMIGDFNHMACDLDRQIAIEQERAGITDVNHYAYPTFAKAAIQRRNNLTASAADLQARLEAARGELDEACAELRKMELLEERDLRLGSGPCSNPAGSRAGRASSASRARSLRFSGGRRGQREVQVVGPRAVFGVIIGSTAERQGGGLNAVIRHRLEGRSRRGRQCARQHDARDEPAL
jgi:flagellar export protein FliJ